MHGLALVAGAAALVAQTGLVAWGSWRVARRWWPDDGLTTLVAALVIGLSYVVVVLEVLGTVGLLVPPAPLLATVLVAAATARLVPASEPAGPWPPRPDRSVAPLLRTWPGRTLLAGVAAAGLTTAAPVVESVVNWRPRFDALASHLPVLAQMVQRDSTWFFPYASPVLFSAHYPANAELVAAWLVVPLDRDFLVQLGSVPGLVLTIAATALLARVLGARPWAALAAALLMPGSPRALVELVATNMQDLQAAGAAVAVLAVAARRWHHPERPVRPDLVLAGLAAGLAVGTRYGAALLVAPGLVLLVVPSLAARATALDGAGAWTGWVRRWPRLVRPSLVAVAATALTGGYFYVRNQVFGGSPLYPESVPWHEVVATERINFPYISSYLELGWAPADWRRALGYIWRYDGPLWLVITGAALLLPLGALRAGRRSVPAIAWSLVPAALALAFLATPAGPGLVFDGGVVEVYSQAFNLRYGIAFAAVAAAALAVAARRLREGLEQAVAGGALLLNAATSLHETWHEVAWGKALPVAAAAALAVAGATWGLRRVDRRAALAGAAALGVLAAVLAPAIGDRFDARRSSSGLSFEDARLFLEPIEGTVAVAGFCRIYGLYGPELDRHVEYLTGDDDGIDRPLAASEDEWLASLASHDVAALVLGSDICYSELDLPYEGWVAGRPDVFELVAAPGEARVYLVHLP